MMVIKKMMVMNM